MNFFSQLFSRFFLTITLLVGSFAGSTVLHAEGVDTVCANVLIRLSQRATFEREAFEASLVVTNGTEMPIGNLTVTINFADAKGNPVTFATPETTPADAKFFVRPQADSWNPTTADTVSGGEKKEAKWLIVPSPGAAGTTAQGEVYAVGATITYTFGGESQTVQVIPDNILVRPMPALLFQYFLPGDVPGFDPTEENPALDTAEPFHFALRIVNNSPFAAARKVKVESNQPEIIANESGLPLNLKIIGTQVNGQTATPGLLANFGDIAPITSSSAWWTLTCNIAGRFIDVKGEITHALDLGGALTSLVDADIPMVRRLMGMVTVDLPGRDRLPDMLATPLFNGTIESISLHESDNAVVAQPVTYVSNADARVQFSADGTRLSFNGLVAELVYVRIPSKITELRAITALRSDGKLLPATNAWISRNYKPGGGWEYWLNLFDTIKAANDTYTFSYGSGVVTGTAPTLTFEPTGPNFTLQAAKPFSLTVKAATAAAKPADINVGALPVGATFTKHDAGRYIFSWTPTAAQTGSYNIRFTAKDGTLSTSRSAMLAVQTGQLRLDTWDDWWKHYWPGDTAPNPHADNNHNGLSNLLEYALDLDPTSGDLDGQPVPSIVERDGKRYLALTYRLRTGDVALIATPQVSGDMFGWRNLTAAPEAIGEPFYSRTGDVQEWRVVDTEPLPDNGEGRFIRLAVRLN